MKEETFGDLYVGLAAWVPWPCLIGGNLVLPMYDQKVWLLVRLGPGQKSEIDEMQFQAPLPPFSVDVWISICKNE